MENRTRLEANLKDAGCEEELRRRFMACYEAGRMDEAIRVLACQRCALLKEIHAEQGKLDALDYLIYKLREERSI